MRGPRTRRAVALGTAVTVALGLLVAAPAGAEEPVEPVEPVAPTTSTPPSTAPPTLEPGPAEPAEATTTTTPAITPPPAAEAAATPPATGPSLEGGSVDGQFSAPVGCFPTLSLCARLLTLRVNATPDTTASFRFLVTKDGTNESVRATAAEGSPADVGVPRLASYRVRLTGFADRYELRSVRCQGIRQSVSDGVVRIEGGNILTDPLDPNSSISCTFNVRRPGSIQIRQTTLPASDADVTYTGTGPGFSTSFVLDNDSLGNDRDDAPSSRTFNGLAAGDYTFSTTTRAGFALTALTCDNGESPNLAAGTVAVALAQGEDVVCRFTFTELATVRLILDVRPDDATSVAFDLLLPAGRNGNTTLDDDGLTGGGRLGNTVRASNLLPGAAAIRQLTDVTAAGLDLTAITCTEPVDATSFATGRVDFRLDPGEDQVCTFRNDRRGSITIVENSVPDGPRDYPYTDSGADTGFTLDNDADPTLPDRITISGIRAGTTRTFTQGLPGGSPPWRLVGLSCSTPVGTQLSLATRSVTVTLDPGANVTCRFDNAQFLPDALVAPARTGPFSGDEVRSDSVLPEQTIEESVSADGRTTTMVVKLQNDTPLTDDLILTGFESGNGGFATTYRTGGVDITAQVLSPGGFRFTGVAPGGERLIAVDFTSLTGSVPGTARKVDLAVHSGTAIDAVDVVRVRARRT